MRTLSGGEDQILQILLGIAHARSGLIIDDPFGMLDGDRCARVSHMLGDFLIHGVSGCSLSTDLVIGMPEDRFGAEVERLRLPDVLTVSLPSGKVSDGLFEEALDGLELSRSETAWPDIRIVALSMEARPMQRVVLSECSYGFSTGSQYVITGRNGIGKSLLLQCIGGVLPRGIDVVSGRVEMGICTHNGRCGLARQLVTYIPQKCDTLLTTYDPVSALELAARFTPLVTSLLIPRLRSAGLLWEGRPTAEGSVGEVRFITHLVAVLRAAGSPYTGWLLADEPDAYLDPFRQAFLARCYRMLAEAGKGVIITSHHPAIYRDALEVPLGSV
jgi:energy-coupling factor transporter ATP-binding protein EcfA2